MTRRKTKAKQRYFSIEVELGKHLFHVIVHKDTLVDMKKSTTQLAAMRFIELISKPSAAVTGVDTMLI